MLKRSLQEWDGLLFRFIYKLWQHCFWRWFIHQWLHLPQNWWSKTIQSAEITVKPSELFLLYKLFYPKTIFFFQIKHGSSLTFFLKEQWHVIFITYKITFRLNKARHELEKLKLIVLTCTYIYKTWHSSFKVFKWEWPSAKGRKRVSCLPLHQRVA